MVRGKKTELTVAVVGATGLVGRAFLRCMEEQNFLPKKLILLASSMSEGKCVQFNGENHTVRTIAKHSFDGVDVALFSAGSRVSEIYAPIAVSCGAVVVDNSSRWRMEKDVPLVVPEINLEEARGKQLIANPNCSTIQATLSVWAIKSLGIEYAAFTTFQAVSGAGKRGIDALDNARQGRYDDFFGADISATCIPQIGEISSDGFSVEEKKMINETRKILHDDIKISATCVRVPVPNGHGISVTVRAKKQFELEDVKRAFREQSGLVYKETPLCSDVCGTDIVAVGRARKSVFDDRELLFFCVADNLLRGAASNAVKTVKGIFS